LVAETLLDKPEDAQCVRHLNDDGEDNRVENLAWGTFTDNLRDAFRNGKNTPVVAPRGERHYMSSLMPVDVIFIRERRRRGMRLREIAELYDLPIATIGAICVRNTWKHLP